MSDNPQSLANQLGWCITTRDYLENLQAEVNHISLKYEEAVGFLRASNYISELFLQFAALPEEFAKEADVLIRHIENEHLSYINAQSVTVRETMERILQNSLR